MLAFQAVEPSRKTPSFSGQTKAGKTKAIEAELTAALGKSVNSVFVWSKMTFSPVFALTEERVTLLLYPSGNSAIRS
jgi:hypothetical protein